MGKRLYLCDLEAHHWISRFIWKPMHGFPDMSRQIEILVLDVSEKPINVIKPIKPIKVIKPHR